MSRNCGRHRSFTEYARCLCLCHEHNENTNRNWAHAGNWLRPNP